VRRAALVALGLRLELLAGCGGEENTVVAQVDGEKITQKELEPVSSTSA
jgi:hypothetical protein